MAYPPTALAASGVPSWAAALMRLPALEWFARAGLASPFLVSGLAKAVAFSEAVAEVRGLTGVEPAVFVAVLVIAVQIGGSALLLTRRWCWLGAGLLAGFTVAATLLAHPFWTFAEADRARQTATFFEHLAIVGGLTAAAVLAHSRRDRP